MAKRRRGKGCVRKKIVIKSKRSKRVIAEFMGRQGSGCGPRPKPKTGHLRHYKAAFKSAVRACKNVSKKRHGKRGRSAFNNCISTHMPK